MKWTYSIKNKLTAASVLFILCLLVLLSNYNDRVHTKNVKKSIITLYEDRLVVEGYIIKLTGGIYQIKELLNCSPLPNSAQEVKIAALLFDIDSLNTAFQKTKLTVTEGIKFAEFKTLCDQLRQKNISVAALNSITKSALSLLQELSAIQIEESKLIIGESERLYRIGKLSSDFAIAIVIVILLILQALVFASRTLHISNEPKHQHLN